MNRVLVAFVLAAGSTYAADKPACPAGTKLWEYQSKDQKPMSWALCVLPRGPGEIGDHIVTVTGPFVGRSSDGINELRGEKHGDHVRVEMKQSKKGKVSVESTIDANVKTFATNPPEIPFKMYYPS